MIVLIKVENLHQDPVVPVLFSIAIILIAAKIGGAIASYFKQPDVLGELIAGIAIGNLTLLNYHGFAYIAHDHTIEILAGIGVIILLFEVGLESNMTEMLAVGMQSFIVAIVGVITPFAVGYYASGMIITGLPEISKIFMGAILTATSVGITARVFQDLNFTKSKEARIVLGAAVIDDIMGLIILAIVAGIAQTGEINPQHIAVISTKAIGFVVIALFLGKVFAKQTVKTFALLKLPGMMLSTLLILCFMGAYLANQVGLATIVGAFAVGLVLDEVHFDPFKDRSTAHDYIRPIAYFLVPIFFITTGMHVDLSVFTDIHIFIASVSLTVVAILGKLVCGWCFTSKSKINRGIIGFGMVPRGEVGLIFATVGKSLGVVDDRLYAITVIVVILTTLIPPPILSILIKNQPKEEYL
jgi:Kef-type K+ transport system membrane component KefB